MKKNTGRFIQLGSIVFLILVAIALNIVISNLRGIIEQYIGDMPELKSDIDSSLGDLVVQSVAEEGFVLLKNDNDTLPLKDTKKINLFGWCSSKEGMLMCGGGSGDFTMYRAGTAEKDRKKIVGLEEALETLHDTHPEGFKCEGDCGFEVNKDLVKFYENYCTVNRNGGTDGRVGWFNYNADPKYFNMVEPNISTYPSALLSGAEAFSDTAAIVITRTGGESLDLPKYQRRFTPGSNPASADGTVTTNNNKTYLQLSTEEEGLINYVKTTYKNVVVILNTSAPIEAGFIDDPDIDAAVYISTPGQSGTVALANILRGNVTPSGRLVDTFAYDLKSAASWANSPNANVTNSATGEKTYTGGTGVVKSGNYIDYAEGIYVGYKWYETADKMNYWESKGGYDSVVQYPFGFGLSYTDFSWTVTSVIPANNAAITDKTTVEIKVEVKNTGDVKGQDVVQIYYEPPYTPGGIEKASKNLVAFAKTKVLEKNESQVLTLQFKGDDMKSYDYDDANGNGFCGYELEGGSSPYKIMLSTDAHRIKTTAAGAGVTGGIINYSVASTIKIDKDIVTENTVENRFTGDSADGGVSIDGTNSGANIKFLTRSDFAGTFPQESTTRRAAGANFNAARWLSDKRDTDVMPIQGAAGDLNVRAPMFYEIGDKVLDDKGNPVLDADGNPELYTERTPVLDDKGVQKIGHNMPLINNYGDPDNFDDDEMWDELLNQITAAELRDVVLKGGYQTHRINSIGKPILGDYDGPTGFNHHPNATPQYTGFPSAIVAAGTWNMQVAVNYGSVVGYEGNKAGYGGWYAPGMNTHRSPFCGRNYEYFSEDGFIAGMIGAGIVKGAMEEGIYSYIKHYAVNDTENNRTGLYTWLTEQSLREIYLKPFELAVKVGKANAIMSSYNRIGDTWTGGSWSLMTGVLRNEWGFKGTAVTDYCDNDDKGLFCVDQGIRAGNDIWLENGNDASANNMYFRDTTSATAIACSREATKHVIYTYCNTIKVAADAGNDTGGKDGELATSAWVYWWIAGDIVVFLGLAVWTFFVLWKLIPSLLNVGKQKSPDAGA